MISRLGLLLCLSAVFLTVSGRAAALELAIFDVISQGSGVGNMTSVRVTILDGLSDPGASPAYRLGDYLTITPADVGSTFTITAATDLDFTTFVQTITNGTDQGFGYSIDNLPTAGGQGVSWTEANLFAVGTRPLGPGYFTSIGQLSGPDFAGYEIVAVTLRIDRFDLSSGWGGNNHDLRATATIVAVPEPGTAGTLAMGLALL